MKKKANAKKDGEKKKQKNALKQLQDRLLEEAKKKMGSSNPSKLLDIFLQIEKYEGVCDIDPII